MVDKRDTFKPERIMSIEGQKYGIRLLGGDAVGSTSLIYLAYKWNEKGQAEGAPLILKRFETKDKKLFKIEYDVLSGVAVYDGKGSEQHFPRLHGFNENEYFYGAPSCLLLMDYAGADPVDSQIPLEEEEALLLITHYLKSLITLAQVDFSCWDRKLKDFFWTPPDGPNSATERLIVIDWNMAQRWSSQLMGQDLTTAGRLLYQLLTGTQALKRAGSDSYDLLQEQLVISEDDEQTKWKAWHRVSFGAQTIVEHLLSGRYGILGKGLQGLTEKQQMIAGVKKIIQECHQVAGLWKKGLTPLRRSAERFVKNKDYEEALKCTSIIALRVNSDPSVGWLDAKLSSTEGASSHTTAKLAVEQSRDYLAPVRQLLEEGKVAQAQVYLTNLLSGDVNLTLTEELSILRWLILVEGWSSAWGATKTESKTILQAMDQFENRLHQANFEIEDQIVELLSQASDSFRDEFDTRRYIARAEERLANQAYSQASELYQRAKELLEKERQLGAISNLWQLIQQSLSELDRKIDETTKQAIALDRPRKAINHVQENYLGQSMFKEACQELEEARRSGVINKNLEVHLKICRQLLNLQKMWNANQPQ